MPAENEVVEPSLRESLAAAVAQSEAPAETVQPPVESAAPEGAAPEGETPEQAAQRLRDEKGRFTASPKADAAVAPEGQPAPEVAQQTAKPRPPVPSTWKKEHRSHWDNLDPALAEYLVQREGEFAKGVSTYKGEWERVRPVAEVLGQFEPVLRQHGLEPAQWVQSLGQAQLLLATGTPEQKRQMVQTICQQYGIDLTGQADGQQPGAMPHDPRVPQLLQQVQQLSGFVNDFRTQQQRQQDEAIEREIQSFRAKPGNEHYEQVRETMAGLLQSGLADDLQSAYEAALRHPRHADIFEPIQRQQREAEEKKRRDEAAEAARKAKAAAASVRGSTPSAVNKAGGAKDLRAQLSEAYEEVAGGRV